MKKNLLLATLLLAACGRMQASDTGDISMTRDEALVCYQTIQFLEAQVEALESKVATFEGQRAKVQQDVEWAKLISRDNKKITEKRNELEDQLRALRSEFQAVERKSLTLRRELDETEGAKDSYAQGELEAQLQEVQRQLAGAKAARSKTGETADKQILAMEEEKVQLERVIASLRDRLQGDKQDFEINLEALEANTALAQEELAKAQREHAVELAAVRRVLSESESAQLDLRTEFEAQQRRAERLEDPSADGNSLGDALGDLGEFNTGAEEAESASAIRLAELEATLAQATQTEKELKSARLQDGLVHEAKLAELESRMEQAKFQLLLEVEQMQIEAEVNHTESLLTLEEEAKELKGLRAELDRTKEAKEQAIQNEEGCLARYESEQRKYQDSISRYLERQVILEQELSEDQNELQKAREEVTCQLAYEDKTYDELEEAQKELATARAHVLQLEQAAEGRLLLEDANTARMQEQIRKLTVSLSAAESDCKQKAGTNDNLHSLLNREERLKAQLKRELDESQEATTTALQQKQNAAAWLKQEQDAAARLRAELDESRASADAAARLRAELDESRASADAAAAQLRGELDEALDEVDELQNALNHCGNVFDPY